MAEAEAEVAAEEKPIHRMVTAPKAVEAAGTAKGRGAMWLVLGIGLGVGGFALLRFVLGG